MTRKEAYEKAREDWDFEEKAFYEVGKYRHDTDTVLTDVSKTFNLGTNRSKTFSTIADSYTRRDR